MFSVLYSSPLLRDLRKAEKGVQSGNFPIADFAWAQVFCEQDGYLYVRNPSDSKPVGLGAHHNQKYTLTTLL